MQFQIYIYYLKYASHSQTIKSRKFLGHQTLEFWYKSLQRQIICVVISMEPISLQLTLCPVPLSFIEHKIAYSFRIFIPLSRTTVDSRSRKTYAVLKEPFKPPSSIANLFKTEIAMTDTIWRLKQRSMLKATRMRDGGGGGVSRIVKKPCNKEMMETMSATEEAKWARNILSILNSRSECECPLKMVRLRF